MLEELIKNYFRYIEQKGKLFNFLLAVLCVLIIGYIDTHHSSLYQFSFLYLFPIAFATWFSGKNYGAAVSLLSAISWSFDNTTLIIGPFVFNIICTYLIFYTITLLVSKIHDMLETEQSMARTDYLTGALNARAFHEAISYEMLRLDREGKPFSIGYIDLDNFKYVNDTFGHKDGDELLKSVVLCLQQNLRRTDVIARMGGDEFVVFFPSTDQDAIQMVIRKIRNQLLDAMTERKWPVTFSMGVTTCLKPLHDAGKILSVADTLMYEVKKSGKDNVLFNVYGDEESPRPQT
jgi:diguanylate cyclase (GGDEF)-like protein